jgi:Uma2 family endonuclease
MTVDLHTPSMELKIAGEETHIDLAVIQGLWSVEQYLRLTNQTNRIIEYTNGVIEVLPMPTKYHQAISKLLFLALLTIVQKFGGDVFYAPLRLQV